MRIKPLLLLLALLCFPFAGKSDTLAIPVTRFNPNISLEFFLGRGTLGTLSVNQAVSFRGGYKSCFFTGRMFRTNYSTFENSWMLGYRIRPTRVLNVTASVGLGDVAFRRNNYVSFHDLHDFTASDFRKVYGLCGEIEAELHFHIDKKPTAWGIATSYYYNFNGWKSFGTFALGVKLHLLPIRQVSIFKKSEADIAAERRREERKQAKENEREEKGPVVIPKNIIRTRFLAGLAAGTHVECEHNLNGRIGYSVGAGVRYGIGVLGWIDLFGPMFKLKGGELNAGFNYYVPKSNGWWSLGVKTAYRHREGAGIWAYYRGTSRQINQRSDDILILPRVAYTFATKSPVSFQFYMASGTRFSYIQTQYNQYVSTPTYQGPVRMDDKEWVMLPSVQMGVDIGFGW